MDYVVDNFRGTSTFALGPANAILCRILPLMKETERSTIYSKECPPSEESDVDASDQIARPSIASVTERVRLVGRPVGA